MPLLRAPASRDQNRPDCRSSGSSMWSALAARTTTGLAPLGPSLARRELTVQVPATPAKAVQIRAVRNSARPTGRSAAAKAASRALSQLAAANPGQAERDPATNPGSPTSPPAAPTVPAQKPDRHREAVQPQAQFSAHSGLTILHLEARPNPVPEVRRASPGLRQDLHPGGEGQNPVQAGSQGPALEARASQVPAAVPGPRQRTSPEGLAGSRSIRRPKVSAPVHREGGILNSCDEVFGRLRDCALVRF
jgi:hypothetical protein